LRSAARHAQLSRPLKIGSRKRALEIFRAPCPRSFSDRKDNCLSASARISSLQRSEEEQGRKISSAQRDHDFQNRSPCLTARASSVPPGPDRDGVEQDLARQVLSLFSLGDELHSLSLCSLQRPAGYDPGPSRTEWVRSPPPGAVTPGCTAPHGFSDRRPRNPGTAFPIRPPREAAFYTICPLREIPFRLTAQPHVKGNPGCVGTGIGIRSLCRPGEFRRGATGSPRPAEKPSARGKGML